MQFLVNTPVASIVVVVLPIVASLFFLVSLALSSRVYRVRINGVGDTPASSSFVYFLTVVSTVMTLVSIALLILTITVQFRATSNIDKLSQESKISKSALSSIVYDCSHKKGGEIKRIVDNSPVSDPTSYEPMVSSITYKGSYIGNPLMVKCEVSLDKKPYMNKTIK